ncbi:MAG: hypothetical protein ACRDRT_03760, partial [Pseudonocardiaceae bacterium]
PEDRLHYKPSGGSPGLHGSATQVIHHPIREIRPSPPNPVNDGNRNSLGHFFLLSLSVQAFQAQKANSTSKCNKGSKDLSW